MERLDFYHLQAPSLCNPYTRLIDVTIIKIGRKNNEKLPMFTSSDRPRKFLSTYSNFMEIKIAPISRSKIAKPYPVSRRQKLQHLIVD